ncbi:MAG TPA: response regulator [Saprospiraceae bacterium]|nr:response regulator [Saprospiraceae bacterium]
MFRSKNILIVDDDADDRFMFREALREINASFICIECENGKDALELLSAQNAVLPDYIFLDLNMPPLNGYQFLSAIKKRKNLCHIPVIIYTTSRYESDKEETKRLGAAHFISKPCSLEEICAQLRFALSRKWEKQPLAVGGESNIKHQTSNIKRHKPAHAMM